MKAGGVDVVIGLIETHGRAETAAKAEGLEIVSPARVAYKGRALEEMDLPGASWSGNREVVLVDELAHTNAPGVENEKRYQDVEDILDAGISVMTTVNIQHFESLQDIVSRVTGRGRPRAGARSASPAGRRVRQRRPALGGAARATPGRERSTRRANPGGARELLQGGEPRVAARARDAADRRPTRGGAGARPARATPGPSGRRRWSRCRPIPKTTRLLLRRASSLAGRLNTNWFAVYVRTPREIRSACPRESTASSPRTSPSPWSSAPRSSGSPRRTSPGSSCGSRGNRASPSRFSGRAAASLVEASPAKKPDRCLRAAGDRNRRLRDRDGPALTLTSSPGGSSDFGAAYLLSKG